jgi:enoyl-CoA hydratase
METVSYEARNAVVRIVLNRPERLNAFTPQMYDCLADAVRRFEDDDSVKVAVLSGAGRAFSVGIDVSSGTKADAYGSGAPVGDRRRIERIARGWLTIWDCRKPVIAQVHGFCYAAGLQIPMLCDVVVAATNTRFGFPRLPMGAGWIAPMLSAYVGPQRAKLMAMTGGAGFSGTEAVQYGYATHCVEESELADFCDRLAQQMARTPAEILEVEKRAVNQAFERTGFRDSILRGAEWDAIAHTSAAVETAREWIRDIGLKAAIGRYEADGIP